jgi:hypothetical protein
MNHASASPFDSIESAHDFVGLFAEAVADAKRDIDSDIQREVNSKNSRRLDAFRLAAFNLERLEQHLSKSRRILNDLRSLRRLLFEERAGARASTAAKEAQPPPPAPPIRKPDVLPPPAPVLPAASVAQVGTSSSVRSGIVA